MTVAEAKANYAQKMGEWQNAMLARNGEAKAWEAFMLAGRQLDEAEAAEEEESLCTACGTPAPHNAFLDMPICDPCQDKGWERAPLPTGTVEAA